MAYREIIRALKGKESRRSLSKEQDAVLPENSAKLIALADAELGSVQGAGGRTHWWIGARDRLVTRSDNEDGGILVSGSDDGLVALWDPQSLR